MYRRHWTWPCAIENLEGQRRQRWLRKSLSDFYYGVFSIGCCMNVLLLWWRVITAVNCVSHPCSWIEIITSIIEMNIRIYIRWTRKVRSTVSSLHQRHNNGWIWSKEIVSCVEKETEHRITWSEVLYLTIYHASNVIFFRLLILEVAWRKSFNTLDPMLSSFW